MKICIYNCHHALPSHTLTSGMFATLVSGMNNATDGTYLGDLHGLNIAADNAYTELRHQYYVWKNLLGQHDYVGFEHYRRMFFLDPMPMPRLREISAELSNFRRVFQSDPYKANLDIGPDPYDAHWAMRRQFTLRDELSLVRYISGYDIITQRPAEMRSLEDQWKSCLPAHHWDILLETFRDATYFKHQECMVDFGMTGPAWNNMYIMKTSIFHEYMTLMMECLDAIKNRIEPLHRGWGHFSERIFNFYIFQKTMEDPTFRVGRLPYLLRTALHVEPLPNKLMFDNCS